MPTSSNETTNTEQKRYTCCVISINVLTVFSAVETSYRHEDSLPTQAGDCDLPVSLSVKLSKSVEAYWITSYPLFFIRCGVSLVHLKCQNERSWRSCCRKAEFAKLLKVLMPKF